MRIVSCNLPPFQLGHFGNAVICLETLYGQMSIIHWLQVGQLSANQKLVIEFTENICNFLHSPEKEKQKRKT